MLGIASTSLHQVNFNRMAPEFVHLPIMRWTYYMLVKPDAYILHFDVCSHQYMCQALRPEMPKTAVAMDTEYFKSGAWTAVWPCH